MDNNIRLRMYPLDEIKRESDIVREAKAQTMMNEVPGLAASMGLLHTDGGDYMARGIINRDYRGHAKDGVKGDKMVGKLPWHPTFSNESPYSNAKTPGGQWISDDYRPSVQMVNDGRTRGLAEYMANVEPDSKLLTPIPMRRDYFEKRIK